MDNTIITHTKELAFTRLWKSKSHFLWRYDVFPYLILQLTWFIVTFTIFEFPEDSLTTLVGDGTNQTHTNLEPTSQIREGIKENVLLSRWETYFLVALALFILQGLTFLSTHWDVRIKCFVGLSVKQNEPYNYKADLKNADFVEVHPIANRGNPEIIPLDRNANIDEISFTWTKRKFIFNSKNSRFEKLVFPVDAPFSFYLKEAGLNQTKVEHEQQVFGENRLRIPLPGFWSLYKEQAVAPFFVFQVFCVTLWMLDEYWLYSLFTLFLLLSFEMTVAFSRLRTLSQLRTVDQKPEQIFVRRDSKWVEVGTDQLVPGDIVCLNSKAQELNATCDFLLLQGHCIVNEAMLTGESTPKRKESIMNANPQDSLDLKQHKLHTIFSGTKIIQHGNDSHHRYHIPAVNNGPICYVLRTGFHTTQGKLLRMILYSTQRVTANTWEAFIFLGILLVFALFASGYVLMRGLEDENRSRYKLILNCTWIITAVVPPELPMQLSLAVNSSLISLARFAVFCTEPFRIPNAGKLDVVCFDKTGTLTTDQITARGLVPLLTWEKTVSGHIEPLLSANDEAKLVLVGCQSVTMSNDKKWVGDAMEVALMNDLQVSDLGNNCYAYDKTKLKVIERFYFNSNLKRMSCIVSNNRSQFFCVTKGAPEKLRDLFAKVPENYDKSYTKFAREGYRVLAFGLREISRPRAPLVRENVERELTFLGFVLFESNLKKDSASTVQALKDSSHQIVMITGDNILTAVHVAEQLKITENPTLFLEKSQNDELFWGEMNEKGQTEAKAPVEQAPVLAKQYDLCVSGAIFDPKTAEQFWSQLRPYLHLVRVFARVSPEEKEAIIVQMSNCGLFTMMVGDGSNDVGALKQASVGVSVINNEETEKQLIKQTMEAQRRRMQRSRQNFQEQLKQMQEEEDTPTVQMGDASIASPFTSKRCSLSPILDIIRQGRCTLVTTHQMFKILALNCLITAYGLSVLHLDGVKIGDMQAMISGVLVAFCFLFISRSQPLKQLSIKKPQTNLFNPHMVSSVICQFAIHLTLLIYTISAAHTAQFTLEDQLEVCFDLPDPDAKFSPSLINTCVFLLSSAMQLATFAVNYQGPPFMQSISENKGLFYTLAVIAALILTLATGEMHELNEYFQMTEYPSPEFALLITGIIMFDWLACFSVDRALQKVFVNSTN